MMVHLQGHWLWLTLLWLQRILPLGILNIRNALRRPSVSPPSFQAAACLLLPDSCVMKAL